MPLITAFFALCRTAFLTLAVCALGTALTQDAAAWDGAGGKDAPAVAARIPDALKHAALADREAVEDFYAARNNAPFWITANGGTNRAKQAQEIFAAAWTHGLNPETYHAATLKTLTDSRSATDKARLDVMLTDGALRYGRDLGGMRIDPKTIKQKAEYWVQPPSGSAVLDSLTAARDPLRGLRALEPDTKLYRDMQKELVRLAQEESDYDSVLPMAFGGNSHFRPGSRNKDIAALRIRLGLRPAARDPSFYDDDTAAAVMAFQREHGLEPDGIIGPQTLAVLNRTNRARMEQIVANMERLRWLDRKKPARYLLVNIPQQLLWGVDRGKTAFETKVVVGMPSRRTKEFRAEVEGVRFNPKWTVPINLKMQDFLPRLKEDPHYLAEKGIEVIRGYGNTAQTLDPASIDWHSIGWREMNTLRFVQKAGDFNALGRIRILMPNIYNIYMHDTNHPEFFERGQRTYSSGCIRLSEPEKVADFVLNRNPDWSASRRGALIEAEKTVEVEATEHLPVYIVYQTIWRDARGRLVFGPDIYKRDRELLNVLAAMDGYHLPGPENTPVLADNGVPPARQAAYNN